MPQPKSLGLYGYASPGRYQYVLRQMDGKLDLIPAKTLEGLPSDVYSSVINAKGIPAPGNALEHGAWTTLFKDETTSRVIYGIPNNVKIVKESRYDLIVRPSVQQKAYHGFKLPSQSQLNRGFRR